MTGCVRAIRKLGWEVALSGATTDRGSGRHTHIDVEVVVPDEAGRPSFTAEFYEYYWASMTKGRIVWTRVLSWLRKTVLTPLGQISYKLAAMKNASEAADKPFTKQRGRFALYRELFRFIVFVALFVVFLALPVVAVKEWSDLKDDVNEKYLDVLPIPGVRLTAGLILAAFALVALWSAYRLGRDRHSFAQGFGQLVAVAVVVAAGLLVLASFVAKPSAEFNDQFWNDVGDFWVTGLWLVLTVVFAAVLRWALVKSVGDIALFVDSDERSDLYESRKEILKGSEELMLDVLRDDDIDQVYLVGQSLGSVVAVATVDRLISRARLEGFDEADRLTPDQLAKMTGLVTFGSPLDKVYYFFHGKVQQEQPVRTQLLHRLHGFRRWSRRSTTAISSSRLGAVSIRQIGWPTCRGTTFTRCSMSSAVTSIFSPR